MNSEKYADLSSYIEDVIIPAASSFGKDSEILRECIHDLMTWHKIYNAKGVGLTDLSAISLYLSLDSILYLHSLEEAEHFARFARDRSVRSLKIIQENWPPPDPNQWPYADD